MAALVLGLDVGGSKTHALLYHGDTVQGEVFAGSANPSSVGVQEATRQLDSIFDQLGIGRVGAVCAGAAGVDTTEGVERFRRLLAHRAPAAQISVVHDTALVLAAAGASSGIVVISGTGSVAWGRSPEGQVARAGGWGYLLGDEGSGYWVTREAVRHALARADQGLAPDELSQQLAADCGLQQVSQLLDQFYANPERRYWASRARIVFQLAAAGDRPSSVIVAAAADALTSLVLRVADRLGAAGPVVLGGGLAVHQPALHQGVQDRLSRHGMTDLQVLDKPPAYGAVTLAQALLSHRPTLRGRTMTTGQTEAPAALMNAEIGEQPQVWRGLLASEQFIVAAEQIKAAQPRFVLLAARGTSDHAALYAKYLLEVIHQLPVGLVSPSTMTAYGARPDLRDVLMIGISQSGGSPDLIQSLQVARAQGALTLAVTNNADSELAHAVEVHVDVLAGTERAVAATKSYTAQLLALYLLLDRVRGGSGTAAGALPDLGEQLLRQEGDIAALAQRYRFAQRLVTTARGYSYPTAREAALKLMETSYLSAQAFSGADLMHGPLAVVDAQVPVLTVIADGPGGNAMREVLPRLTGAGADVFTVGTAQAVAESTSGVVLPVGVPEELSPILEILPFQQLAMHLAVARGQNPDAPRGLLKITQTR